MEYAPPDGYDDMMQKYTAPCHGCRAMLTFMIHPGMNGQLDCPFCGAVVYSRGVRVAANGIDTEVPGFKRIELSQESIDAADIPRNPAVGDRKAKVRKKKDAPQGAPLLETKTTNPANTPEQDEALRKMLDWLS